MKLRRWLELSHPKVLEEYDRSEAKRLFSAEQSSGALRDFAKQESAALYKGDVGIIVEERTVGRCEFFDPFTLPPPDIKLRKTKNTKVLSNEELLAELNALIEIHGGKVGDIDPSGIPWFSKKRGKRWS